MADLTVRFFTADDADAVADMWLALVAHHQSLASALPAAARGGEHRYVRRLLERQDDPHLHALVAEADGLVVGFVVGMVVDLMQDIFLQSPSGFLADIYVEPQYRRLGVGRALVNALQNWFAACGVESFEWHVSAHNEAGLAFWRSLGGEALMIRMRATVRPPDEQG